MGRILHDFGVRQVEENDRLRLSGMALSFTGLLFSGAYLLVRSILAFPGEEAHGA